MKVIAECYYIFFDIHNLLLYLTDEFIELCLIEKFSMMIDKVAAWSIDLNF